MRRRGSVRFFDSFSGRLAPLFLGLLALTVSCHPKLSESDCTKMIDRYVDMEISRDEEVASAAERSKAALIDAKKAQMKADFAYTRARSQCVSEVSKSEFDCAMRAETPEGWQACID